jgi:periplasmic copper chaperone A
MKSTLCIAACVALSVPVLALAHVTLEQNRALAASTYKAVFRIPHGCNGAATTSVAVFLPPGFVGTKPMPKAGWKLDIESEALAQPYESNGKSIAERVAVVRWSGGRLPESAYDEFILRTTLPADPGTRWIRVLQTCEQGQIDWGEVPEANRPRPTYPAPRLEILPADAAPAHQH